MEPAESVGRTKRAGLFQREISARKAFGIIAAILGVILLGLVIFLVLRSFSSGFSVRGGEAKAGIQPILTITGPGKGPNPTFSRPLGAAFGEDGRIYVADTGNNRVCVFDRRGRFLFEFGGFGVGKPLPGARKTWTPGKLNYPVGIDVDDAGNVYVADFRNDQIHVFDSEGTYISSFPENTRPTGKGSSGQDGQGIAVTDVTVFGDRVYATDTYQVFVFTSTGELIAQFGKPGGGPADLDHPNGVAVGPDGTVYVSDSNHNRIVAFDRRWRFSWNLGTPMGITKEKTDSEFGLPRGLAVADDGSIFVADAFNFEIVHVSAEGKVLARYGERGVEAAQLNFPNDVDVRRNDLLVTDKENDRVQVVRLVGR